LRLSPLTRRFVRFRRTRLRSRGRSTERPVFASDGQAFAIGRATCAAAACVLPSLPSLARSTGRRLACGRARRSSNGRSCRRRRSTGRPVFASDGHAFVFGLALGRLRLWSVSAK